MKLIVVGVLYPIMRPFWPQYRKAINDQTDTNFELWLFDNNYPNTEEVTARINSKIKVQILPVPNPGAKGPTLWQYIIPSLQEKVKKENVKVIIFTDTDDYFDKDRVAKTREALQTDEIVFTDLIPTYENGKQKSGPWYQEKLKSDTISFVDNIKKNLCGLNNTAIRANLLEKIFPITSNLVVTDWWIFSSLLAQGHKAKLLKNSYTYYRQYDSNIAGMKTSFNAKYISYGINLKKQQYKSMLKHLTNQDYKDTIKVELEEIANLENEFKDPQKQSLYLQNLNTFAKARNLFWREEVDLKFLKNKF